MLQSGTCQTGVNSCQVGTDLLSAPLPRARAAEGGPHTYSRQQITSAETYVRRQLRDVRPEHIHLYSRHVIFEFPTSIAHTSCTTSAPGKRNVGGGAVLHSGLILGVWKAKCRSCGCVCALFPPLLDQSKPKRVPLRLHFTQVYCQM